MDSLDDLFEMAAERTSSGLPAFQAASHGGGVAVAGSGEHFPAQHAQGSQHGTHSSGGWLLPQPVPQSHPPPLPLATHAIHPTLQPSTAGSAGVPLTQAMPPAHGGPHREGGRVRSRQEMEQTAGPLLYHMNHVQPRQSASRPPAPAQPAPPTQLATVRDGGRKSLRYNSGYFINNARAAGIDVQGMVERLRKLIVHADDLTLMRLLTHSRTLPLRLLEPAAPGLREALLERVYRAGGMLGEAFSASTKLQSALGSSAGLHLTLAGLASALTAWGLGMDTVHCPPGYPVIMAPVGVLTVDAARDYLPASGSAKRARRGPAAPHGEPPTSLPRGMDGMSVVHEESPPGEVGSSTMPMCFLLREWPHLAGLFDTAPGAAVEQANDFVFHLSRGEEPVPGPALIAIMAEHQDALVTPTTFAIFGGYPDQGNDYPAVGLRAVRFNSANGRMIGMRPDVDGSMAYHIRCLHPDNLFRRCLVGLAARAQGAATYMFEAHLMRALPPADPVAHARPRAEVAPEEQPQPASSPLYGRRAIPLYTLQVAHLERYSGSGRVFCRTTYTLDAVSTHTPIPLDSVDHHSAQLDAIERLVLAEPSKLPPEMRMVCRQSGLNPLEAMVTTACCVPDSEPWRVNVRMALLAARGAAEAAAEAQAAATTAAASTADKPGGGGEGGPGSAGSASTTTSVAEAREAAIAKALQRFNASCRARMAAMVAQSVRTAERVSVQVAGMPLPPPGSADPELHQAVSLGPLPAPTAQSLRPCPPGTALSLMPYL